MQLIEVPAARDLGTETRIQDAFLSLRTLRLASPDIPVRADCGVHQFGVVGKRVGHGGLWVDDDRPVSQGIAGPRVTLALSPRIKHTFE